MRTPTPADGRPACYGRSHDADSAMCGACPHVKACAAECVVWSYEQSLAEMADAARFRVDSSARVWDIYCRLYTRFYGGDALRCDGMCTEDATVAAMDYVRRLHDVLDIDPVTYVMAQMDAMKPFLEKEKKKRFMPNMLSGPRAMERFSAYLRVMGRRYRSLTGPMDTLSARVVEVCAVDEEYALLRRVWFARMAGRELTCDAAVADCPPGMLWQSLFGEYRLGWVMLVLDYGAADSERIKQHALYAAAARLADDVRPGLSSRLAIRRYVRDEFLTVLLDLAASFRRACAGAAEVQGGWTPDIGRILDVKG